MSPGGVAGEDSVTLTLADAQGMLDGVTLSLNAQVEKEKTTHTHTHTDAFKMKNGGGRRFLLFGIIKR